MHAALVSAAVELGETRTRKLPDANLLVSWVDFPAGVDKRRGPATNESRSFLEEASAAEMRFGMRPRNGWADSQNWV